MRVPAAFAFALCTSAALTAQPRLTQQDAARFQAKLTRIQAFAAARSAKAQSTELTDVEVNSYLRYSAGAQVPVGMTEPTLNALGNGRVAGRAIVDLDAVRHQKQRGWTDPLGYLSGKVPVTASGTLTTSNGTGQFALESAEISGVTVPKFVLQELLSYYSRTPETPNGIDMDAPFQLPARIKSITVGNGSATVIQ
ncbi:MAG TPA: hypothetical protein VL484_04995 [Vicinamibacterales bacterium]|jgi:hypothetical protein|nr:hypothetical protein [Vicinamibacterales bacterium]